MTPSNKPLKQPISVLVVLHDGGGNVLLIERADRAGFWQSVTGSIENGETLAATARREVAEETGILLSDGQLHDWQQSNRYEIYLHWRHRYPMQEAWHPKPCRRPCASARLTASASACPIH